jgi:hypothetical protein
MKSFFIITTLLIFLSACSHKNAYTNFGITKEQELAATSFQSTKVKRGEDVEGIFSAIYLNKVYPQSYNQNEYFYISLYLKEAKEIYNPDALKKIGITFRLNSKLPVNIQELPAENKFSHLGFMKERWNKYYLVIFENQGKELNLVLESDLSSSAALAYQKGE